MGISKQKIFPIIMSIVCFVLLLLHFTISIDYVTIALVVLVFLPWLFPYIKSIKFPGGTEITLQDINKVEEEYRKSEIPQITKKMIEKGGLLPEKDANELRLEIVEFDKNLALASLRMDMERVLRNLAKKHDISEYREHTHGILDKLRKGGVIKEAEYASLRYLLQICTRAIHGESIEKALAIKVLRLGQSILIYLNGKLLE